MTDKERKMNVFTMPSEKTCGEKMQVEHDNTQAET